MRVQVRFCPSGERTEDTWLHMEALPRIGELINRPDPDTDEGGAAFKVVDVHWFQQGVYVDMDHRETPRYLPLVVAHSLDRPRARY